MRKYCKQIFMLKNLLFFFIVFHCRAVNAQMQRIQTSSNGKYLQTIDGQPFFYLGDTGWDLFHRLNKEEAGYYLQNRKEKGFNVVQAVLISEFDNGPESKNYYGKKPFNNKEQLLPAVDKNSYDYWQHADYIVNLAHSKNLYMGMVATWGEWVTPRFTKQVFNTEQKAYRYGNFLGHRYRQSNIIWILGGDRRPHEAPNGFALWRAMAEGIADGVNNDSSFNGKADYSTTMMTFHCFANSADFFEKDEWIDFHSFGSYHEKRNNSRAFTGVEEHYQKRYTKPILNSEPLYEDHPVNYDTIARQGYFDEYDARQQAYWSVFSGACGHTYGCHPVWQFSDSSRSAYSKATRHSWKEALDLPGSFQMLHLKNLILSRPQERAPAQELVANDQQTVMQIRACKGSQYAMLYIPDGEACNLHLDKLPFKKIKAWWYNPRDGQSGYAGEYNATGNRILSPPGNGGNDWVLVLDDAAAGFDKPGRLK